MNVREEDRKKNSCPSRGLGLAAAALGVGVGAALYYFFSKRPENPDGEGSTTDWSSERPHPFSTSPDINIDDHNDSDSYTTVSEHSTTDTSMEDETHNESVNSQSESSQSIDNVFELNETSTETDSNSDSEENDTDSSLDEQFVGRLRNVFGSNESVQSDSDVGIEWNVAGSSMELPFAELIDSVFESTNDVQSDSDVGTEWDVTDSSVDVPSAEHVRAQVLNTSVPSLSRYFRIRTSRIREDHQPRNEAFRERSWSLEECSICFEVILKDHKVTTLPCTHHFHSECITPWLQEQQTCPNCRKAAE